jgi:putative transposase
MKTEAAGRVFPVDTEGTVDTVVTGLAWRDQVFEEAAVDLGKGLKAWSDSRSGKRKGKRVGFPKKKAGAVPSFRLRNKHPRTSHRQSASARASAHA